MNSRQKEFNFETRFKTPPVDYYPIAFWSWNDVLDQEEIRHQFDLMVLGKMGGVILHARVGLITPYLEEKWFEAVQAAIDCAKEKGLKIWIYDEDGYPSGFAGGSVPLEDKSYRMKMLLARPVNIELPNVFEKIGKPSHGFQIYKYTAQLDSEWFNGTCYIDTMNQNAVGSFVSKSYQVYYDRYAKEFGNIIGAGFTDEPCPIYRMNIPSGAVPFSENLLERFFEMHGYDAREKLHLLFTDQPDAPLFRLHYFRTVNDLFENSYSKQIGAWCNKHKIAFTGHYVAEGSLYDQQLWGLKIMPNYRHLEIPGIDLLCKTISEKIAAKQCQSIVNQYGKKRMLSELFGVTGSALSFQDRLWLASQQLCLGVNLFVPHLSLYTMAGCRKRDFPPNLFYQQPWWKLNGLVNTPMARIAQALTQGRYHAKVLLLHPQESTFVLWKSKWQLKNCDYGEYVLDSEPIEYANKNSILELEDNLNIMVDTLLASQCSFDFGDETIIAEDGKIITTDGRIEFSIGKMSYQVVVLPSMITIAKTTFELLQKFQLAGGTIIQCGQRPKYLDAVKSSELDRWLETIKNVSIVDLAKYIHQTVIPIVELLNEQANATNLLWSHVRDLENGDAIVYLTNLDRNKWLNAELKFNGSWQSIHLLDKWTGEKKQVKAKKCIKGNALNMTITFKPADDYLLLLSNKVSSGDKRLLISSDPISTVDIDKSSWQIGRSDDNAMTLDYAYWAKNDNKFSSKEMPVIAIQQWLDAIKYDGLLALKYPLKVGRLTPGKKVHLIVEHSENYQIFVNGLLVEYAGLPFWCDIRWLPIDITNKLSNDTENFIELRCNRFQHGDKKTTHNKFARYGTEIEAIYLVGDFGVYGELLDEKPISSLYKKWDLPPINVCSFKEKSLYLSDTKDLSFGDTTTQGLPFYSGTIMLKTKIPSINLNDYKKKAVLKIDKLDAAIASVSIDGQLAGYFFSDASSVDITNILTKSSNELVITLYGTLNNLLGPHHHIDGVLTEVSPFHYCPTFENRDDKTDFLDWAANVKKPFDWTDRYCFVGFGNIGSVKLSFY